MSPSEGATTEMAANGRQDVQMIGIQTTTTIRKFNNSRTSRRKGETTHRRDPWICRWIVSGKGRDVSSALPLSSDKVPTPLHQDHASDTQQAQVNYVILDGSLHSQQHLLIDPNSHGRARKEGGPYVSRHTKKKTDCVNHRRISSYL